MDGYNTYVDIFLQWGRYRLNFLYNYPHHLLEVGVLTFYPALYIPGGAARRRRERIR